MAGGLASTSAGTTNSKLALTAEDGTTKDSSSVSPGTTRGIAPTALFTPTGSSRQPAIKMPPSTMADKPGLEKQACCRFIRFTTGS
jgi:hypothetical protein